MLYAFPIEEQTHNYKTSRAAKADQVYLKSAESRWKSTKSIAK